MAENLADLEASLVSLAERQFLIELSRPFVPSGCIDLGETISEPSTRSVFGPVDKTPMARAFRVRNVILHGPTTMLFRHDRRLRETRYLVPDAYYASARPTDVIEVPDGGPVVIGFHKSGRGYFHWMTQCVPAIHAAMRYGGSEPMRLALPPLNAWQAESLDLLGYGKVDRVEIDTSRSYLFDGALYCEYLNGSLAFEASLSVPETFAPLRRHLKIAARSTEILYVARTDTHRRAMRNEDALVRFLECEGVTIVVPSTLSVADQILAFGRARLVMGPHGAGLTNIVFCPAHAAVYELHPAGYMNACYNRLAQAHGLDYWADAFPSDEPEKGHALTWAVDLEIVKRRFQAARRSVGQ